MLQVKSVKDRHPLLDENVGTDNQHGKTLLRISIPRSKLRRRRNTEFSDGQEMLYTFSVIRGHLQRRISQIEAVIHKDQSTPLQMHPQQTPFGFVYCQRKFLS